MFNKNIPPACLYCEHSQPADSPDRLICHKEGVVTPSYKCRRYRYDPTKRQPPKKPILPVFDPEDFRLD